MKSFTRTASVVWEGSHQHGEGAITSQSAVLNKARCVSGLEMGRARGTNPPELIAAAHASSFSIALANELGDAGYSPVQIDTTATVTMEHIAAKWTMTRIRLDVIASVPRAAQCDFIDAAVRAKTSCFISRLLHANIWMCAKLKRGMAAPVSPKATAARPDSMLKSIQPRKITHDSKRPTRTSP
jgi:osmotically inducible protein OsmC